MTSSAAIRESRRAGAKARFQRHGVDAVYRPGGAGNGTNVTITIRPAPDAAAAASARFRHVPDQSVMRERVLGLAVLAGRPGEAGTLGVDDGGVVALAINDTFTLAGREAGSPGEATVTLRVRGGVSIADGTTWTAEVGR